MKKDIEHIQNQTTEKEILNELFRYCAYQERAVSDVIKQLERYKLDLELRRGIVEKLIAEGFLDEARYAKTYMLGKLRSNQWGRIKIIRGLKEKSINVNTIQTVIETIDEAEYTEVINKLITKKENSIHVEDTYIKKNKIARYIIYKGFESGLVWDQINKKIEN
jgi:regulatory protein